MPDTMHIIMDMRHLFGKKDGQEGKKPGKEKNGTEGEQPTATDGTQEKAKPAKKPSMKDWDKELKKRLDANAAMDPESRSSEGDIRNQFWKDFFGTFWKPEVAELLFHLTLLKEDIIEMGFNPLINPFLAFLKRPFAQKLVLSGQLNAETFEGLHNGVAKNYVADSEFVKENVYNVIYCLDLYTQTAADIEHYLRLQSKILSRSAPAYNEKTMAKNIKTFLVNGFKSMRDKNAKLQELDDVESFMKQAGLLSAKNSTKDDEDAANGKGTKAVADRGKDLVPIVKSITENIQVIAALLYLNMTTNSKAAKQAVAKLNKLPETSGELLANASAYVAKQMQGLRFDDETIETFIEMLLDKQKELAA